jgi:hypothetical protein
MGIVLSCVWVIGFGGDNIFISIFTGVVQGVLCATSAVGTHQMKKQNQKDSGE